MIYGKEWNRKRIAFTLFFFALRAAVRTTFTATAARSFFLHIFIK